MTSLGHHVTTVPDGALAFRASQRSGARSSRDVVMKAHTVVGDRLCVELHSLQLVRPIVRSHHERLDDSGYPDGLKGGAIPLLAHIVGIVDAYDAMTTDRPYRRGRSREAACLELERDAAEGRLSGPPGPPLISD